MFILETKNLIKRFDGVHAVDNLSIAFEQGKITSVIGPNGSGKSTLVNTLTGMIPIDGGAVVVSGTELKKIIAHKVPFYGMTRTFQDVRLFEQMTVLDNMLIVLTERKSFSALFAKHTRDHLAQAEEVLRKVGLYEKRNALAINLSYGQRKLLEIGRVLAVTQNGCEIILLDEPFAGLFKEMVRTIVGIIQELKTQGKTIILIEHNMDLIRELSDHVFVLDSGKLLAHGTSSEVLSRRDVIEAYLGE